MKNGYLTTPLQLLFIGFMSWIIRKIRDRVGIGWDPGTLRRFPREGIEKSQWDVFLEIVQNHHLEE